MNELRADMRNLDAAFPKELRKVSLAAARDVSTEAKTRAPKRTGRLARAVKPGATAKGADVRISGVPYAGPIVFGWRGHNIEPNPFIYDALDARRDEVLERYQRDIAALVAKTVRGGFG